MQDSLKKYVAEALGTFTLTLFGCGSAAIASATLGTVGIALAFGLSIVAMAFVIGNVSGCHINPAVTFGLFVDGRISMRDLFGYWVAQFVGGIAAAFALLFVVTQCGALGGVAETGLGCNGFDAASSTGLTMTGAIVVEVILTCVFVLTILGVTADGKTSPFVSIVIDLCLVRAHHGHPPDGHLRQPRPQLGPALAMATTGSTVALDQVWVFIFAPLVGAALAAAIFRAFKSFYAAEA